MASTRPVPWVSPLLCLAVLAGGAYYALVDTGPSFQVAAFSALLLLLIGLDAAERRVPAAVLLLVQTGLYVAVNALDDSGIARALFVLVPFTAYFTFGRRTAIVLGTAFVAALPVLFTVRVPGWQTRAEHVSDVVMFALGIVLAITMAAVAVREREARVRLEGIMHEVEALSAAQERNRLAREIHDSLGHHLTAIAVQLEKADAFAELDPSGAREAVGNARWSADRALTEVRQSVRALGRRPFRLTDALTDLINHLDGLTISLDVTGDEEGRPLASLTALYRAAQEALTNACRHSGATNVRLTLAYEDTGATLTIKDNGQGFPAHEDAEGFGLRGMRDRIALLDGSLDLASGPAGTTISIRVPW
ncbi:sensor histidine kinase [Actinomadura sp. KC06]|uniref:sensor histidine kinase n=1 Tax=Actinomadura sp. KC06 TaxID=2530369 RepID=UPI0010447CB2|nr:sensor histidine kinase [Actinomadura sp. KC06]TDD37094.1 sensor histidine kinase [Actinomadura sp. KC06]